MDASEGTRWKVRPKIDLRWEVSASPTAAMWDAMKATTIGMADFGEDPTVTELEERVAELTGHEAALLVPTVTVGTVLAVLAGAPPGTAVLMEERAHIYWVEEMHMSALAGAVPLLLSGDKFGAIPLDSIQEELDQELYGHRRSASLLCLENTHNICGGTILTPDYINAAAEFCKRRHLKLYLDGARLFNAAVALKRPIADFTSTVDYAVIGLNKGLAAPFGAVVSGSQEFIDESKVRWRRLGSMGMHKAGLYAAACLVALDTMVDRLNEDHGRARQLAEGISQIPGLTVDLETVQTNLVRVETPPHLPARELAALLAREGIAIHVFEPFAFKLAVHLEITDEHIDEALKQLRNALESQDKDILAVKSAQ